MHSHCVMGDVFGSTHCDCHATIEGSMRAIAEAGRGAIIYLHQTSKGFSVDKIGDRTILTFHRDRALPTLPRGGERKTQREIGIGAPNSVGSESQENSAADQSPTAGRRAGKDSTSRIVEQVPVPLNRAKAGFEDEASPHVGRPQCAANLCDVPETHSHKLDKISRASAPDVRP